MPLPRTLPPAHSPLSVLELVSSVFGGAGGCVELERVLRQDYRASHLALTDSGTSALRLAISHAARNRELLPCLMPAYGCFDLATAAVGAGTRVRFYDIDPSTLAPDLDSMRAGAAEGASSIVVVHQFGFPVPFDDVRSIATRAGALVIEDAAQALGGHWNGRPLGSFGDYAIFSFGRGKGIAGGGGALLARGAVTPDLPREGAFHRATRLAGLAAQSLFSNPWIFGLPARLPFLHLGQTRYRHPSSPKRISDISSRVVLKSLARLQTEIAIRRQHGERLAQLANDAGFVTPRISEPARPSWLRLPLLPPNPGRVLRRDVALGIARGYPIPLPALPQIQHASVGRESTPGADHLALSLVTLPTHSLIEERDLLQLEHWVRTQDV